jgi:UDP-N-acetylglucosamine:LPS N-acetylglucosamine transferase
MQWTRPAGTSTFAAPMSSAIMLHVPFRFSPAGKKMVKDQSKKSNRLRKVLAVASGGGHWIQLRRLADAFSDHQVTYVTTIESYRPDVGYAKFHVVTDASRWNRFALLRLGVQLAWIIAGERPDVVISTGAAPGYLAIRLAKLIGARTIWVDSIANVEELSLSGRKAGRHVDLWLTQWPHLALPDGPHFRGAVL